jgi:ribonuclease D
MSNFLYKNDLPSGLNFGDSIAIDTETMGLNVNRDRLCLIQISSGDGNAHLVQFDGKDYSAPNLKKLLSDEKILKIFHFARFDLATIKRYLGVEITHFYCTKIASKLVRTYTDSHGLKTICSELIGVELCKKQQSSYWGSAEIDKKQIEYAASDVLYLHALKKKLDVMLDREGRSAVFQKIINFLPTCVELDLSGFNSSDILNH